MPRRSPKLPVASAGTSFKFDLSEKDWIRIEKAYGRALASAARTAVQDSTRAFLMAADFEQAAPEIAQAKLKIMSVRTALSDLRHAIVESGPTVSTLAAFKAKQMIAEQAGLAFVDGNDGLTKFAWTTVIKMEEACNSALADLAEQHEAGGNFREGTAWQVWICKLGKALGDLGLPIGVRKDADKRRQDRPSAFVACVAELQQCIPAHLRRSTHSHDALAKAIYLARKADITPPFSQEGHRDE